MAADEFHELEKQNADAAVPQLNVTHVLHHPQRGLLRTSPHLCARVAAPRRPQNRSTIEHVRTRAEERGVRRRSAASDVAQHGKNRVMCVTPVTLVVPRPARR